MSTVITTEGPFAGMTREQIIAEYTRLGDRVPHYTLTTPEVCGKSFEEQEEEQRPQAERAARLAEARYAVIEAAKVWHRVSWDDHDDAETALSEALNRLVKAEAE